MSEPDRPTEARPTASALKDRYEILERIGKGGFGEVWKARDTTLNRLVAIKRLPPDATSDSSARERLRREALSASALNHSNICTVYDLATVEGEHFLVMEYIEGRTIHELLAEGPLAPERRPDLARLGFRAMIAGTFANFLTATIAGMLL